MEPSLHKPELIALTADIVAAHVSNNRVPVETVADLVTQTYQALLGLGNEVSDESKPTPVVSVRASVKPEYLTCLACGAKQKTLKRHLQVAHQMSPAKYREAFDLAPTYPMVAADYAKTRSELAKSHGLGNSNLGKSRAKPPARRSAAQPRAKLHIAT